MNLFFYFIINRMSEELMMKYFVSTDKSQLEEIRRREFERRLSKLRCNIQSKVLDWSNNNVVNKIKAVINELNDFLITLPPGVFDKKSE